MLLQQACNRRVARTSQHPSTNQYPALCGLTATCCMQQHHTHKQYNTTTANQSAPCGPKSFCYLGRNHPAVSPDNLQTMDSAFIARDIQPLRLKNVPVGGRRPGKATVGQHLAGARACHPRLGRACIVVLASSHLRPYLHRLATIY